MRIAPSQIPRRQTKRKTNGYEIQPHTTDDRATFPANFWLVQSAHEIAQAALNSNVGIVRPITWHLIHQANTRKAMLGQQ
jgi:hypothetical protein